jgi:hypothetical protein
VVIRRDGWFRGRVYSRRLRGKDWTWRSNIIVMWEYAKHEVMLSMEIYRNGLDKVNRLSLFVGELTVKVVIVPLSTAGQDLRGGAFRQARRPIRACLRLGPPHLSVSSNN